MKKQLILSLALFVMAFSFAQKKEVKALEKAVKSQNYAEAKTLVGTLESMVGSMDDKMKTKFYIGAAKALFANGTGDIKDITKASSMLGMISDKKNEAVTSLKQLMSNDLLSKANDSYSSKDFVKAASDFENLFSVAGDQAYLYYAAVSAIQGKDMDTALKHYVKLDELGYTGETTEYFATNKETGEEEVLDKATRDIYVKGKTHINPGQRKTESKVAEITKNIALIYANKGETEKALSAMKKARETSPDNSGLIVDEANLYYKLGDKVKYKELISQAIENDPNNPELLFNLGVLAGESGDISQAREYYEKSLSIKPNNTNALTNMASLILDEEKIIIEKMNKLGSSSADNRKYDEYKAQKNNVYKQAIPYLEKVLNINSENAEVAKTLMNIYSLIGEDDKFKALKAKFN